MGILRLLLYGALLWLLVRLVKGLFSPEPKLTRPSRPQAGSNGQVEGGELVQDPQCGVYIPKDTALRDSQGEYFCGPACRDAYRDRKRGG